MCFIGILTCVYGANAEWEFESLEDNGFKDSSGKNFAVFKGTEGNKNLFADGLSGKAVRFEGGKYQLKIANSNSVSLKNNFTIRCVFKANKINSYRTLLWKGNRKFEPQQINYYLDIINGKPEFKFKEHNGNWITTSSAKPLIESGKWYSFTVTMDSEGLITGYLNGKQCFKKLYKPGALVTNSEALYIGAGESYYGGGIGYPFSGLIDQVSISSGIHPPKAEGITEFERLVKLYEKKSDATEKLKRQEYINTIKDLSQRDDNLSEMATLELKALAEHASYNRFFKKNSNAEDFIISVLPTTSRILRVNDYSSGKFKLEKKAVISAARNEYEGFQLILLGNTESDVENIKISLPDLTSTTGGIIPANSLEWGFIRSIKTSKPQYDVDFVGYYPDPIMEGQQETITAPKNGFSPVYVRVHVDKDVIAGNYTGKIKVGSKQIDINLRVYDFTLPETSSCKVIFSFFEDSYAKWYNKKNLSDKEKMYIYDFLLKYRVTPNNIYSRGIYPELKFLPELKKKGANFCTLGYLRRKNPVSTNELKEIISSYSQKFNILKKAGFENEAYLYAFDEVGEQTKAEKDAAKQIMTAIHKELPEIKTVQTSSPVSELLNCFNVWVPSFSYFVGNEKEINELGKEGKTFWWYCADSPIAPFPNFFMDYPVFNNRIIFTLSYMYKIEGVLYWAINREWSTNFDIKGEWPEKAWKPYITSVINKKRKDKNGMGNYVYPGKNGRILPSLRLENLRDGVEDYEYLMILKKLVAKNDNKQAEKLLQVPVNVARAVNQYSENPENLINYRNEIALMIEALKTGSK